jgi:hypothetical protein
MNVLSMLCGKGFHNPNFKQVILLPYCLGWIHSREAPWQRLKLTANLKQEPIEERLDPFFCFKTRWPLTE